MTNADKFQEIFGYYATEMWAKSEKEFLEWINTEYTSEYKPKNNMTIKDEDKTVKLYCGSCKHFEVDSRFSTDWCKEHQESKNAYEQACNDFFGKGTVIEECLQCACLD